MRLRRATDGMSLSGEEEHQDALVSHSREILVTFVPLDLSGNTHTAASDPYSFRQLRSKVSGQLVPIFEGPTPPQWANALQRFNICGSRGFPVCSEDTVDVAPEFADNGEQPKF